jgi:high-affinity K+ transport system ATPase subunit B
MDTSRSNSRLLIIEGFKKFFSEKINYTFFHAIIILIVVCMSLYNLSFHPQTDKQLWRDLLLFTFGLIIPTPQEKPKN